MNTSDSISSIFTSNSSPPQSTDSSLEAVNQSSPFPCPCRCHHRPHPHPQTHHRHHNHHTIHHHRPNNTLDSPNESGISPPSPSSDQVDNATTTTTPPVHKTTSRPPRLIKSSQPINIFSSSSASHRHRTPLYDSDSVIDENIEFDSAPKRHIVEPPKNITINQSQPKSLCDCHRRLLIIYNNYNSDSNKIISMCSLLHHSLFGYLIFYCKTSILKRRT